MTCGFVGEARCSCGTSLIVPTEDLQGNCGDAICTNSIIQFLLCGVGVREVQGLDLEEYFRNYM